MMFFIMFMCDVMFIAYIGSKDTQWQYSKPQSHENFQQTPPLSLATIDS